MIERYCDACKKPMPAKSPVQPEVALTIADEPGNKTAIWVRITRSVNGVANAGDVCVPCIQHVVELGEWQFEDQ